MPNFDDQLRYLKLRNKMPAAYYTGRYDAHEIHRLQARKGSNMYVNTGRTFTMFQIIQIANWLERLDKVPTWDAWQKKMKEIGLR